MWIVAAHSPLPSLNLRLSDANLTSRRPSLSGYPLRSSFCGSSFPSTCPLELLPLPQSSPPACPGSRSGEGWLPSVVLCLFCCWLDRMTPRPGRPPPPPPLFPPSFFFLFLSSPRRFTMSIETNFTSSYRMSPSSTPYLPSNVLSHVTLLPSSPPLPPPSPL